jgi:quercetin dioxygenase-like cupin family protein
MTNPAWRLPGTRLLGLLMLLAAASLLIARGAHQIVTMSASRPGGITGTTISQEKLSHVAGKSITVEIVEFAPLAFAPEHHHAGSVTVYVLAGSIRSQIAGGPLRDYKAGESFFEPPGAVHLVALNPSPDEPAKFMAIHIAPDGAQLTTYH